MDIFILAALSAIAVTLLLLVANVERLEFSDKVRLRLGQIFRLDIARRASNLIVVTLSILVLLFLLLIALGAIHPRDGAVYKLAEFFLGRRFGSIILGLSFGTMLIFWLRQLLLLEPGKPITWVHRTQAILLIGLFALGGFSDWIALYAKRVTQISAAGLSLTFDPLRTGSGNGSRGQPKGGGVASNYWNQKPSIGALDFLADMKTIAERDRNYVRLLGTSNSAIEHTRNDVFFEEIVGSSSSCFRAISLEIGDDYDLNNQIRKLNAIFSEFTANGATIRPERIEHAVTEFASISSMLMNDLRARYFYSSGRDNSLKNIYFGCQGLIKLHCPDAARFEKKCRLRRS